MDIKYLDAGHGSNPDNWRKFAIGRYAPQELTGPTRYPGCAGCDIVGLRGFEDDHIWVLDLHTGEGLRVHINGPHPAIEAHAVLRGHQVLVSALFEPMLAWLLHYIKDHPDWWDELPGRVDTIEVIEAVHDPFGHWDSGPGPVPA